MKIKLPWSRIIIGVYNVVLCLFVLLCPTFKGMPSETITAGYFGLLLLLGTWLGVDFSSVVSKSLQMPKGQAEKIKCSRYVFAIVNLIVALVPLTFLPNNMGDRPMSLIAYAIVVVLGTYIAGRKSHSIVKNKCGEKDGI